jgi:hypothetical protein
MFISQAAHIDVPVAAAVQRLLDHLEADTLSDTALEQPDDDPACADRTEINLYGKQVAVHTVPPYQRGETTVLPMRWVATGPFGRLFPTLDANVELDPAEGGGTDLTMIGTYRAPLGSAGAVLDHAALHVIAETTLKNFLARLEAVIAARPHAAPQSERSPFWGAEPDAAR